MRGVSSAGSGARDMRGGGSGGGSKARRGGSIAGSTAGPGGMGGGRGGRRFGGAAAPSGGGSHDGGVASGVRGGNGAGSGPVNELEVEIHDLWKRFALVEGDRKAYYELSEWQRQTNQEAVAAIRVENRKLRDRLKQIQSDKSVKSMGQLRREVDKCERDTLRMRNRCDEAMAKFRSQESELLKKQDQLRDINLEAQTAGGDSAPGMKEIHELENGLDRVMIKYNEAMSVRKTYEHIIEKLSEQRLLFDASLHELEAAIKTKDREYQDLLRMSRDAAHARDTSAAELARFLKVAEEERAQKQALLEERREMVRQSEEAKSLAEKKLRKSLEYEEEQFRRSQAATRESEATRVAHAEILIAKYEKALRKIKDATGVQDVNKVIKKFMTQEDTHANLISLKDEVQAKIDRINGTLSQLRSEADSLKYCGAGQTGNRRLIEEFESHVATSKVKCERNRQLYERVTKLLISVKAGVEHLADKVSRVRLEADEEAEAADEEAAVAAREAEAQAAAADAAAAAAAQARSVGMDEAGVAATSEEAAAAAADVVRRRSLSSMQPARPALEVTDETVVEVLRNTDARMKHAIMFLDSHPEAVAMVMSAAVHGAAGSRVGAQQQGDGTDTDGQSDSAVSGAPGMGLAGPSATGAIGTSLLQGSGPVRIITSMTGNEGGDVFDVSDDDSSDDNEDQSMAHDRLKLKQMSEAVIERKTAKRSKRRRM